MTFIYFLDKTLLPPLRNLSKNWIGIRLVITVLLLLWATSLSIMYKVGDARQRQEVEFYDRMFMGYKHTGVFVTVAKIWIFTILAMIVIRILPPNIKKLMHY